MMQRGKNLCRRPIGYTLIELLVVISSRCSRRGRGRNKKASKLCIYRTCNKLTWRLKFTSMTTKIISLTGAI
jgi:hypothetical protein